MVRATDHGPLVDPDGGGSSMCGCGNKYECLLEMLKNSSGRVLL